MGGLRDVVSCLAGRLFCRRIGHAVSEIKPSASPSKLPDELLLQIFMLAAEDLNTHERGRLGLSIMLLSHKWRVTGFQVMFGPVPTFAKKADRACYRAFLRQTLHDPELARSFTHLELAYQAMARCTDFPHHVVLQHITYGGEGYSALPPSLEQPYTSVTLRNFTLYSSCFARLVQRLSPFGSPTLTSLSLVSFAFSRSNPSTLLSPRLLPSLTSLLTSNLTAQQPPRRLHAALRSLLPQLTTLTAIDWNNYPSDALAHCSTLTTLRARLLCRDNPALLTQSWPYCLPPALESLALITSCVRACRHACDAVLLAQELLAALVSDAALLPALRELVVAGPLGYGAAQLDRATVAELEEARGVRVERREREGVEWLVERACEGRL
ncbi:hypothetical protein JCM10450v2_003889 [Rhodotorula kratochvilovae]